MWSIIIKILIALVSSSIAILGIYSQKVTDKKFINKVIISLLMSAVILTVLSISMDYCQSKGKDLAMKTQHSDDSLLLVKNQNELFDYIDSATKIHKSDSIKLIACNVINANGKNVNLGNADHVGDNNNSFSDAEILFNKRELKMILDSIKLYQKKYSVIDNTIYLARANNSNARKKWIQLCNFLESEKGFKIKDLHPPSYTWAGVTFKGDPGRVMILVGEFF